MFLIDRFEENEGKQAHFHVAADPKKPSDVPAVHLMLLIDSDKAGLSIFLVIFSHLFAYDNNRFCDNSRLSLDSGMDRVTEHFIPLVLQLLYQLVYVLAIIKHRVPFQSFCRLRIELLKLLC